MYTLNDIVGRVLTHHCSGKTTRHSLCNVELRVAVNYITIIRAAQQCFYGKFILTVTGNIAGSSLTNYCSGKTTMHSLCNVELRVAANYIRIICVAQQCFYGKFILTVTMERSKSSCKVADATLS